MKRPCYNYAAGLKALKFRSPIQFILKEYERDSTVFHSNPHPYLKGLNTLPPVEVSVIFTERLESPEFVIFKVPACPFPFPPNCSVPVPVAPLAPRTWVGEVPVAASAIVAPAAIFILPAK